MDYKKIALEACSVINTILMNARQGKTPIEDYALDWRARKAADDFVHKYADLAFEAEFPNPEARTKLKAYAAKLAAEEEHVVLLDGIKNDTGLDTHVEAADYVLLHYNMFKPDFVKFCEEYLEESNGSKD